MKYKLIISDYDGTLAGRDNKISPSVIKAIKAWLSAGHRFTIATGRQYLMIKKHLDELNIAAPVIVRGGSEIVDSKNGKVLYSKMISTETLQEIMHILKENGFEISIEKDDKIYSDYYRRPQFQDIITFKMLSEFPLSQVPKMVIFALQDIESKSKFVEKVLIKKFPELHIVKIYALEGMGWDITSTEATKHLMVLELIKMLDLNREEVVGVGNGYNDFSLLEACGFKVAMGNATEELKAIADLVVPSYQEDGVAVLIEKLLKS